MHAHTIHPLMTSAAIEMKGISVVFGVKPVLNDLSLSLCAGEKVCLRGPSGSGKSTVLRCIAGLVIPRQGEVRIQSEVLTGRSAWSLRRHIAMVPQEPAWSSGTLQDVLLRPFDFRANQSSRPPHAELNRWMIQLELPRDLLDKDIKKLSGGEKQRAAFIAAMLLKRPILLLDEATSALDQENKHRIYTAIGERPDLTVLAVSHDATPPAWASRTINMGVRRD